MKNYKEAVAAGCRKLAVKIDPPQHVYWDRYTQQYLPVYPAGSIFDVVVILEQDGKMLGLTEGNSTLVFTEKDIYNGEATRA